MRQHGWSNLRSAIPGALSVCELNILATEASLARGRNALEVGHYKGLSTAAILDSLPEGIVLWTIDHHEGDANCQPTETAEFEDNIRGYAGQGNPVAIYAPFEDALDSVPDDLRFVFYDADHSVEASESFWRLVQPKLGEYCVIIVDDADWQGGKRLHQLATLDGFKVAEWSGTTYRGSRDKADPRTNTIEVLTRGGKLTNE